MINLLLASTEGPTPDEIISGASEAVQEAVDNAVEREDEFLAQQEG